MIYGTKLDVNSFNNTCPNMVSQKKLIFSALNALDVLKIFDIYSHIANIMEPRLFIIMYHRVGQHRDTWSLPPINPLLFEAQINYLSRTHKIISMEEMIRLFENGEKLTSRTALITFDDGYKDNYTYALPVLKKYKLPATIFLTTGHIGSADLFWWDKLSYILTYTELKSIELPDIGNVELLNNAKRSYIINNIVSELRKVPEESRKNIVHMIEDMADVEIPHDIGRRLILSWDEVKEMRQKGVSFGAHTVTHPVLSKCSTEQARWEIMTSKKDIERQIGEPVDVFSYPYGLPIHITPEIMALVKESGFKCAVTTMPNYNNHKTNLYKLGRMFPAWDLSSFKFILSGIYTDLKGITS